VARRTSFYYAFLTLPADQRRAILAVFDFCKAVDDSVDLEPDPARAIARVAGWREEVDRVFGGRPPATGEGQRLQPHASAFQLTRANFDALVDGVAMDVTPRRFQTFADLEPYCHRVASAVGLMCVEIFGYREGPVFDYARDLGVALQLTNILRDVGGDYAQGRVYLPQEDLARFGATEDDIAREVAAAGQGVRTEALRKALDHQAARARVFFARAVRALPDEDRRRLIAAETMRAIYAELLARIEAADFDVFSRLIRVPRPARARLALAAWRRSGRRRAR
jgi:phytoene synthase